MSAVEHRLRWMLRRHWLATVLFALMAGLTGAISLAAFAGARRTDAVFDQFLDAADPPELTVTFCPPGLTTVNPGNLGDCIAYDAQAEVQTVRGLPEVAGAARGAYRAGVVRPLGRDAEPRLAYLSSMLDADIVTPDGRPAVVSGRLAGADAPDEVMVNAAFVENYRLGLGDRLSIRPFVHGEDESTPVDSLQGSEIAVTVVGVVRTSADLSSTENGDSAQVSAQLYLRGGVDRRLTGAALGFGAILVQARDADAATARAALERAFPGRLFNAQYGSSADDVVPLRAAYRYEADAARAVGVLSAVAGLIFVGQAMARQARREWADIDRLRAIGFTSRQAAQVAVVRGTVIAVGALAAATAGAIALSGATPIGSSHLAELHPGVRVDLAVLALGLPLLVAAVLLVSWFPVHRLAGSHRRAQAPRTMLPVSFGSPNASMTAGVGMAVNGGRTGTGLPVGTALIGVALAAATLVGAAALAASLHHLTTTPSSFGATWDRSIADFQVDEPAGVRGELAGLPGVDRAAAFLGSEFVIGGESTWGVAFEPIDEGTPVVHPHITAGREPVGREEIALGALTMNRLGLRVGDRVDVATQVVGRQPLAMSVVGVAVMNATDEGSPGLGAVLSPAAFHAVAPEEPAGIFVVDLADGAAGRAADAALQASFPNQLSGPVRQQAIRNLERIRLLPWLVAVLVSLLAAASLAHALVSSVQRNRSQLAVLATLGFTRAQISAAVAWQASALALAALTVGIPIGLLVARSGWRAIAEQLGVATPVIVPVPAIVLVALVALAFAPVVSFLPGRRVGKMQPAEALRSE